MIITILIFIVVLSLLVFVHELGHFVVAKRSGMKVHEFGFGFPPRLFGIQKVGSRWRLVWSKKSISTDSTVYSINAIPVGGFVKIMGEDNDDSTDKSSFTNKSFSARLLTLAAGVLMNVLVAWVLLSIGYMVGMPEAINQLSDVPASGTFLEQQILIGQVKNASPAQKAEIKAGDIVLSVNGQVFTQITELQNYIKEQQGQELSFHIKRLDKELNVAVQTSLETDPTQGIVGVGLAYFGKVRFGFVPAIFQGAQTTLTQLKAIVVGLANAFGSVEGLKNVGGPVKIAQLTGQVADLGIIPLLQFTAFLSLNLAILNTLPFPALDGGRMLFLIVEKIRGRPNNQNIEQYANAIGFMLLLLLMVVITVRDVSDLQIIKNLLS